MKNKFKQLSLLAMGALVVAAAMNACQDPGADASQDANAVNAAGGRTSGLGVIQSATIVNVGPTSATECTVTDITTNTTWSASNTYILYGDIRVNNGATLTIDPGTIIKGDKASKGTLTIERGAKIIANGTATSPIVFTSAQPVNARAPKDWGGINILGRAPVNAGTNVNAEGYPACVTRPQYGGTDCADNSGVLRYVRIEYAGIPVTSGDEKNSLTLYGVGNGTIIEHVQSSFGGDDSFEFFGGCVNAKWLISYSTQDDDFDTDFGYSGAIQYGIAVRDNNIADNSGSNGFESDNNATGSSATPQTNGTFSNFTLIGPYDPGCSRTVVNTSGVAVFLDGMHLRRNTGLDVYNTIVTGWPRNQAFIDNTVNASVLTHNTAVKPFNVAASLCFTEPVSPNNAWTVAATNLCNNTTLCTTSAISTGGMIRQSGLTSAAWTLSNPSVIPASGAAILTNGTNASSINAYFSANATTTGATTYFRGARRLADDNGWDFSGTWVNYSPQTTPY